MRHALQGAQGRAFGRGLPAARAGR